MNWQMHVVLEPDEVLLWEGRPVAWRALVSSMPSWLVGVPLAWFCVARFRTDSQVARQVGFWWFALLAFLFVALPVLMWGFARGTTYVLTNRRAVLLEPWLANWGFTRMFPISTWRLELVRRQNGSGEIVFGRSRKAGREGFRHLADIAVVEPLVRELARQESGGGRNVPD